ncbi:AraC family transcriptional regulator [Paludicola sp. MB14-C6]|uniref:AraC family transcriptional regulator n=1 Tax=Paludihabitans sp. MB14-C6 TaxID=3070656 RepID=UPI0027DCABDD|nr:AraC family transcriptional regulator [Paludicola sp. MB14-C6]WMJ24427.1 AraC family transcriptional regulator [Paludicola sp. MB14-C6]
MIKTRNTSRRQVNIQIPNIPEILIFCKCDYQTTYQKLEAHIHKDCFEMVYFFNGCQDYWVEGNEYHCRSGELFLTKPNELHSSGESLEQKSGLYYIIFHLTENTNAFLGLDDKDLFTLKQVLFGMDTRKVQGSARFKQLLEQVVNVYEQKDLFYNNRIKGLYIEIFYEMIQLIKRQNEQKPKEKAILKSIAYIQEHILENITVEQLAELEYLSYTQFILLFKEATGFSPHDFIVREKIEVAKDMLRYTKLPITQVAVALNFSSSQYFATVFKRYVGLSASEYRNK